MASNTTNRYSDAELTEFRTLIEGKLSKARQELEFMRKQIVEQNENSSNHQGGDWFDDSSMHSELELLNRMVSRQQHFIRNLENAILRINNKSYGICTLSGKLISKKRLMLVPHATKSIAAKKGLNATDQKRQVSNTTPKKKTKVLSKVLKKIQTPTDKSKPKYAEEDVDWVYKNTQEDEAINMLDKDLKLPQDEDMA